MAGDELVAVRKSFGWYEETIPVRGCYLSLNNVKDAYRGLQNINRKFGEQTIAGLTANPEMTGAEWDAHKADLLEGAFCLTVTIRGLRDEQLYGETVDIFDSPNLPKPIRSIFFTNITAFKAHANGNEPDNKITVFLDFGKPALFDANLLASAATPNEGRATVEAQDFTFFSAVQNEVKKKLTSKRTRYGAIHRNYVYDIGLWFVAMPAGLYLSALYMDQLIPIGSKFELFRWPLFGYFLGLSLFVYRFLTDYAKWAFPVNILVENKDKTLQHRLALTGIVGWLFYQVLSTLYETVIR